VIRFELFLGLASLALWVYCLVDAIGTDETRVRHLPKVGWLLIILFFPLAGSVAWLVAGRPEGGAGARRSAYERPVPQFPEYDRPGRAAASDPAADEAFLRGVRARAEEQRARYREEQRRRAQGPDAE